MRRVASGAFLLATALGLAACAAPAGRPPPTLPDDRVPLWVVTHAWHTGIGFRAADAPLDRVLADFPDAEVLEVGWGQREYWMAPEPTVAQASRAALLPSPSAVRVLGFRAPIDQVFVASDVLELRVPRAGLVRLVAFVDAAFALDAAGAIVPLGPGGEGLGRYYLARGRYHALNNSNVWTARALREAGVPVQPALALTAWNVLCQIGPRARVLRLRPDTILGPERGFC